MFKRGHRLGRRISMSFQLMSQVVIVLFKVGWSAQTVGGLVVVVVVWSKVEVCLKHNFNTS